MDSFTRPVDLYVKDAGNWCLTSPQLPIFVSLQSFTVVEIELNLWKADDQFMKPINEKYFILVTNYRVKTAGQIKNAHYPILFLFKEEAGKNHPVKVSMFTPRPENGNRILDMKIDGQKVVFPMSNGKTVTLTFDPKPEYKLSWMSSDGEFIFEPQEAYNLTIINC